MTLPPHLEELRRDEDLRRGLAWLALSPDLLGCPVVLLTPRIIFELHLAGNALLHGLPAGPASIFDFLWRLHPNFRRPDGAMPNHPAGRGSWLLALLARRWLARRVRRLPAWVAERAILDHLAVLRQDEPPRVTSSARGVAAPAVAAPLPHVLDSWCHWWGSQYGVDPRSALDVPLPLILQCRRTVALARGEPVIDPSAAEIGRHLFAQHRRN